MPINYRRIILQACKQLGITQKELAKAAGIHYQTITNALNREESTIKLKTWESIETAIKKLEKGTKK